MDSEGKHAREDQPSETLEESLIFPGYVFARELKVNAISLASSSNNPEVGTEALTREVREVLRKVVEASLERNREMVQGSSVRVCRYIDLVSI
ncbi:hypothetical protein PVK06_040429 [Gossypium arboreum]|uniref:Uncharacterized protein n=1 Tax=Gossypium arboreum TaxID=29729 RepID=A0ABR0N5G1_GOSAR|nr:hypothetical protein PVK06_040429 [Gossypium arboreum]